MRSDRATIPSPRIHVCIYPGIPVGNSHLIDASAPWMQRQVWLPASSPLLQNPSVARLFRALVSHLSRPAQILAKRGAGISRVLFMPARRHLRDLPWRPHVPAELGKPRFPAFGHLDRKLQIRPDPNQDVAVHVATDILYGPFCQHRLVRTGALGLRFYGYRLRARCHRI